MAVSLLHPALSTTSNSLGGFLRLHLGVWDPLNWEGGPGVGLPVSKGVPGQVAIFWVGDRSQELGDKGTPVLLLGEGGFLWATSYKRVEP